jgi:biopolymer transport protein TolR
MASSESMRGRGRGRKAMNEINVVPYIDVMLVLLVIFMVTAPMMTPGVLDLPSVAKANIAQQEPPVEINIQADSSISVRDTKSGSKQNLNLSEVANAVQGLISNTERPVVIAADKSVKYEVVMQVMDELQRAAIPRVGLLVKPSR